MEIKNLDECKRWLHMADMDFGVAEHLFKTYYPKPCEIVCYHCQQCAEKAIKAIIIAVGASGEAPKVHDLSYLLNQLADIVEIDEKYYDYADTLTPYGVSVRYPNELFLEERHAEKAIQMADEVLKWVKSILESDENNE
ncbi:MAG: HEPN domain-containing protein [Oscillospiraceae bacterium]|nr:HEPN domain-containing protein [Oscillospiraceae bacterium]